MPSDALFLNDLHVGMAWNSPPVSMTSAAIIAFAREYDPQPFHIDPVAALSGPFNGLIASGWQVAALAMRLTVEARPFGASPLLGLGIDELRWFHPVRPGDVLRVHGEIVELKASKSKPDRGVVRSSIKVINQAGDVVMSFFSSTQLPVAMAA